MMPKKFEVPLLLSFFDATFSVLSLSVTSEWFFDANVPDRLDCKYVLLLIVLLQLLLGSVCGAQREIRIILFFFSDNPI